MVDVPTLSESVATAMQDAWNDFCVDTGDHPDAFFRSGRSLYADFSRGNFAEMVAAALAPHVVLRTDLEQVTYAEHYELLGSGTVVFRCRGENQ